MSVIARSALVLRDEAISDLTKSLIRVTEPPLHNDMDWNSNDT